MAERPASGYRWQDQAAGGGLMDETHPTRRVVGVHDIRFDGLSDLLLRAHGCSVIDIGCNRGHIGYEFAVNGARLVHGCDIYAPGIATARQWFAELPHVASQFEVVNLEGGPAALTKAFGAGGYDIVLFIGVVHKLKRVMKPEPLAALIRHLGSLAVRYFAWNGYADDLAMMDKELTGLTRIHTSELALPGRPAAIWRRGTV
jgi:2-polyprenyl-3-methyl-5-hydroxy-6-metoxy-1,4-benzoquinol methylase